MAQHCGQQGQLWVVEMLSEQEGIAVGQLEICVPRPRISVHAGCLLLGDAEVCHSWPRWHQSSWP